MIARRLFVHLGILVALTWLVPVAAADEALIAGLRERLADAPVLRGEFEQHKSVAGFRKPLVSRGDFVVARERGVLWNTRSPFASSLVVTRERLLSRRADGEIDTVIETGKEPGLRAINEILFAVMAADLDVLQTRFTIDGELVGNDAWRLVLLPPDAMAARWLSRVELDGNRHVQRVRFEDAQGDVTEIRFSAQTEAQALNPAEAAALD